MAQVGLGRAVGRRSIRTRCWAHPCDGGVFDDLVTAQAGRAVVLRPAARLTNPRVRTNPRVIVKAEPPGVAVRVRLFPA